jgi:hypothetical protein
MGGKGATQGRSSTCRLKKQKTRRAGQRSQRGARSPLWRPQVLQPPPDVWVGPRAPPVHAWQVHRLHHMHLQQALRLLLDTQEGNDECARVCCVCVCWRGGRGVPLMTGGSWVRQFAEQQAPLTNHKQCRQPAAQGLHAVGTRCCLCCRISDARMRCSAACLPCHSAVHPRHGQVVAAGEEEGGQHRGADEGAAATSGVGGWGGVGQLWWDAQHRTVSLTTIRGAA